MHVHPGIIVVLVLTKLHALIDFLIGVGLVAILNVEDLVLAVGIADDENLRFSQSEGGAIKVVILLVFDLSRSYLKDLCLDVSTVFGSNQVLGECRRCCQQDNYKG